MDTVFNNIPDQVNENKFEENLFVKNIIVNKNRGKGKRLINKTFK